MIDERTERLISRKLDGEITEAESLELDKALIRSPEARALLEEHERFNELAGETLRTVLPDGRLAGDHTAASIRDAFAQRRRNRFRMGMGAVAAVILAAVITGWPGDGFRPDSTPIRRPGGGTTDTAGMMPVRGPVVTHAIEGPRNEDEQVYRDVFGVYDEETKSIYLLEMDQTHTTTVPVVANY